MPRLAHLALALALSAVFAPAAGAGARAQLVVGLTPSAARAARATPSARLAARYASLGMLPLRSLVAAGTSVPPRGRDSDALGFDPAGVLLLEGEDSLACARAAAVLAGDPDVAWVEPNRVRTLQLVGYGEPGRDAARTRPSASASATAPPPPPPNDPLLVRTFQWGLWNAGPAGVYDGVLRADVHALEAWTVSVGVADVKIAVADTGIDPDQPELGGLTPDGRTRISDAINVTGEPPSSFVDLYGHGTPVAGVASARTNDGAVLFGSGVAGVAGGDGAGSAGCRLVPIKISPGHTGEATSFDIATAIVYSASVGARAMNLSYAGDGPSRVERNAMTWALTHGCVVVAAAGNRGSSAPRQPQYPAAFAADGLCIQVGASDVYDRRAVFSSYGPGLDLLAPGLDVWTTFMTYPSYNGASYDGYVGASGTSFAAPFVTGAVGLLASARPELQDVDYQRILRESADDIGAPGVDESTGWGRLNLARALDAVRPAIGIWHDEVLADAFLAGETDTLLVGEGGPGTLDRMRGALLSSRFEARAAVAVPDSFLDEVRVWPRIGGTTTVRGDFRLPFYTPLAEVVDRTERSFTLRGWFYSALATDCPGCDPVDVPLPRDQVRFGFTVIGRVDRPPALAATVTPAAATLAPGDSLDVVWSASDADTVSAVDIAFVRDDGAVFALDGGLAAAGSARLAVPCFGGAGARGVVRVTARDDRGQRDRASADTPLTVRGALCAGLGEPRRFVAGPNPFRGAVGFVTPGAGEVRIFDATGRLVRRLRAGGAALAWDGRDGDGRPTRAGLYLARWQAAGETRTLRLVRLGE